MDKHAINKWVLLLLVIFISALFLSMIRNFLMAIFLAGIFSALAYPLFHRLSRLFRGRRRLASVATMLIILFLIIIPLGGLMGIITSQAIKVGETIKPWVERQLSQPDAISSALDSLPFINKFEPYRSQILTKAGELVGGISSFLIDRLSDMTLGTVHFLFMLFVMLYAMYFFLLDGELIFQRD